MINIEYPDSLAHALRLTSNDLKIELKTSAIIKLYELGKVSSGVGAKVLGISRENFLDLLGQYKVSIWNNYDVEDLKEDNNNA
ncbi:MAG: UPF0175 family protein [Bacteroidota bacterium]